MICLSIIHVVLSVVLIVVIITSSSKFLRESNLHVTQICYLLCLLALLNWINFKKPLVL